MNKTVKREGSGEYYCIISPSTLRFRIIGGGWNSRGGGLETLVYINNKGRAGIVGGLETLVCTNNRGVEYG